MSKEFSVRFDLSKGLRPEDRLRLAQQSFLNIALDAKVSKEGLYPLESIDQTIFTGSVTPAWPFPQMFRIKDQFLLAEATSLRTAPPATMILSSLTTFDASAPDTPKAISSGGIWHLANFQSSYFLTNGVSFIYHIPSNVGFAANEPLTFTNETFKTLAEFDGRLFLGGAAGAHFSTDDWNELIDAWKANIDDKVMTFDTQEVDTSWLIWSERGGGGFDWPFVSLLAALGYEDSDAYDKIKSAIINQVAQKELGMLPLRSPGAILHMKKLGDGLAVYTEDTVYIVRRTQIGYEVNWVLAVGIAGRGSVTGSNGIHFFVDFSGVLWSISASGDIKRYGFKEQLSSLINSSIVMNFDQVERDVYIGDSSLGYLLTPGGLSKTTQRPTTLQRQTDGTLAGFLVGSASTEFQVETGMSDLGFRGIKNIKFVEIEGVKLSSLRAAVDYKYGQTDTVLNSGWIPGGPEGIIWIGRAATEFSLKVKGTMSAGSKLESIVVRFNYADDRSVRGPRVPGISEV